MSLADTECTAESVSAVFLHVINGPVIQQTLPYPPSLPPAQPSGAQRGSKWGKEWIKRQGGGVGKKGGGEGKQRERERDDLHI